MCGIFGTTKNRDHSESLRQIEHRGPDDFGTFKDDHVFFGHKRLSILDLSEKGHQPMFSDSENLSITYNGEIYNFKELKKELIRVGCTFKSESDTEVVLKGFEKYGTAFFSKLRGMWALAVYDANKGELTLSRDHFGIKPLFYSIKGTDITFASEVKALIPELDRVTPNTDFYFLFYNFGYFPGSETSFREIKKMLPGEILTFNLASGEVKTSFADLIEDEKHDSAGKKFITSETEAAKLINKSLLDSVEKHYLSDVPVGLLLSGGNDSSYLAALSKQAGQNPTCFSVSIEGSGDAGYARKVADYLKLPFEEEIVTRDIFKKQYEELDNILDQPTGDVSFIPTSLIFSKIKGKAKVVLSGEGGDELFGGYLRHKNFADFREMGFDSGLQKPNFQSRFGLNFINPILNKVRKTLPSFGGLASEYVSNSRLIDLPIKQKEVLEYMEKFYNTYPYKHSVQANLFFDLFLYLPYNLMYKGDSSSMAYSIESRVPFLDKSFLNAVSQISPELRLSENFKGKAIMKKAMKKFLPEELIYRKKSGFGIDIRKYIPDLVLNDLRQALSFHAKNSEVLGVDNSGIKNLMHVDKAEIILKKYPRFAYALITNHKLMRKFV